LLHLDGVDLYASARLHGLSDEGLADAQAAVVALEQAQALWPEGLGSGALTDALILLAIYETATEDAELSAYWSEHQRVKGTAMTLHGLLARGSSMNALIDNAAFERSIELRRIKPDAALGLLDFVVAMLAS